MKRYDSYKDSGVEWIGGVPEHWGRLPIKYFGEVTLGKMLTSENKGGYYLKPYLRSQNIQVEKVNLSDVKEMWFSESEIKKLRLYEGDLLFNEGGDVGRTCLWNNELDECYIQNSVNRVRFEYDIQRYFLYLSVLYHSVGHYDSNVNRVSIPHLTKEKLESVIFLRPPLPEQQQIVSFLDTKTTLIDTLIEKTQRKIELLKEQRTSLINHTVTKGLNPNVEMKDSGVEWIGEIPSHWVIKSLKFIVDENVSSLSNNTDPNYELDYLEISDVNSTGSIKNPTHYLFSESPSRCRRVVNKGDVIISTVRTYLKSIGIIDYDVKDLICSTGFSVLSPKPKTLSKHLFYMVRSEWFISDVISKSVGVSYPSIQSEKLMNIKVLDLPLSEQQQIVEYLDEQTQIIDTTITKEQKRIELLKEYRQSLISEVVTGKIKVTTDD